MASARRSTMDECGCAEARDEGHDTAVLILERGPKNHKTQEWIANHLDF